MSTIHMPQVKNPFHPGEILEEEFLLPKGLNQTLSSINRITESPPTSVGHTPFGFIGCINC